MKESVAKRLDIYMSRFHSPETSKKYLQEFRLFEDYMGMDFEDATHEDVVCYVEYLERRVSASTQCKKLHILSAFGEYLYEEGVLETNPFKYSYGPSTTYHAPEDMRVLSPEECEEIFQAMREAGDLGCELALRIIRLTGSRLDELLKVQLRRDVTYSREQDRYEITFHNFPPFQLARRVSIPDCLSPYITEYLNRNPAKPGVSAFLVNQHGTALESWTVHRALKRTGYSVTVRDFKNSGTIGFFAAGASTGEVSSYTGKQDRWLHRYREAAELSPSLLDRLNGKE